MEEKKTLFVGRGPENLTARTIFYFCSLSLGWLLLFYCNVVHTPHT